MQPTQNATNPTEKPTFTAEDFREGDKPFAYLWSLRKDPLAQQQAVEETKAAAAALGVKSFPALWKAYQTSQKQKARRARIQAALLSRTEFTDQPMALLCGGYTCTDEGVTAIDGRGQEVVVCSHPILPVRRLISTDGGEVKLELAWRREGQGWRRRVFPKSQLSSATGIVALSSSDIAVTSENARPLVKYIADLDSMNYADIPTERSADRLGWVEVPSDTDIPSPSRPADATPPPKGEALGEGSHSERLPLWGNSREAGERAFSSGTTAKKKNRTLFIPYDEGVRFDGEETFGRIHAAVRPCGDPDAWLGLCRSVRSGESVAARILLAASFASALVEPCRALPFFVHLWGGSGAGKTVALKLAASVWADPESGNFVSTYNATSASMELTAGFLHSLPLCIDELQIDARRDLDETVYRLAEGVGKGRGSKTGGVQKTPTWRLCILSTGEMPITAQASRGGVLNRCIEIDCKDAPLFRSAPAVANTVVRTFGHGGRLFVDALRDMGEETVSALYNGYVKELNRTPATGKQIMAAAVLLTADCIADACVFEDGRALTVEEVMPYLVTEEEADVNRRALHWISDWIASNPMRFRINSWGEWTGECWGLIERDYICVISSVLHAKLNEAGYSPTAFLSWAKRESVIIPAADGKSTTAHRIAGQVCRCVRIKRGAVGITEDYELES